MKAAVVHGPDQPPRYESFAEPELVGDEVIATMLAAGLHQLVRGHAAGSHYSSSGSYPLIPGVDGVAQLPDGRRVYMGWLRAPFGTFAERAAVPPGRVLEIPHDVAPEHVAAIMNPASSSWLALRLRARIAEGDAVMVLGATGASGQLAVQLARALGAGRVIAVGRNVEVLESLGADGTVALGAADVADQLRHEFERGIDIVLDYLWGRPAELTLDAIVAARGRLGARRIRYVNIGAMAGDATFSPHALRSTNLEMLGSGLGSIAPLDIVREMPALLGKTPSLSLSIERVPIEQVTDAWQRTTTRRIVIVPSV